MENFVTLLKSYMRVLSPLISRLSPIQKGQATLSLAILVGGTTILKKIIQNQYDVFKHRPVIGIKDKATLLLRSFLPGDLKPMV